MCCFERSRLRVGDAIWSQTGLLSVAVGIVQRANMEPNNLDVKLALEEMRFNMQQSLSAGDALDQKVNLVLASAGLLMAIGTTLQISLAPDRSDLYWFILLTAIGLYVLAVAAALTSASPQTYRLAIASNWAELNMQIFGKSERDVILTLLAGYVDQIQFNWRVNHSKARRMKLSLAVLGATVVLLIILVVVP